MIHVDPSVCVCKKPFIPEWHLAIPFIFSQMLVTFQFCEQAKWEKRQSHLNLGFSHVQKSVLQTTEPLALACYTVSGGLTHGQETAPNQNDQALQSYQAWQQGSSKLGEQCSSRCPCFSTSISLHLSHAALPSLVLLTELESKVHNWHWPLLRVHFPPQFWMVSQLL